MVLDHGKFRVNGSLCTGVVELCICVLQFCVLYWAVSIFLILRAECKSRVCPGL